MRCAILKSKPSRCARPTKRSSSACLAASSAYNVLSHDVLAVFLRLPAAESFDFAPGQYIDILLPGGRRRSFSIASPPHDSRPLELHVRRVPGGELTERLFAEDAGGTLLSMEGPLGQFVYRHTQAPMLLVAGGTGLAPLKSIIRHVIENALEREMILYWGVRGERDLYAHEELDALARRARNFQYQAILSEPGAAWTGRRGWVHEAVLNDIDALHRYDVYASGPPALVCCRARGVSPSQCGPRANVLRLLRLCARHARTPADDGRHQSVIFRRAGLQNRRGHTLCAQRGCHARARHQPVRAVESLPQGRGRQCEQVCRHLGAGCRDHLDRVRGEARL